MTSFTPAPLVRLASDAGPPPFARILTCADTDFGLSAGGVGGDGPATQVTIELRQTLHGFLARLGSHLVRRAAASTIDEALDGLERIVGRRV